MCIDEVIENQQKTANQVDGKYKVVVSGAGVTCMEKPTIDALLPGIRLHFLRYALFPKNNDKVIASRVEDRTDDNFTLDDADASNGDLVSTDNFIVACTPLNKGYVYLFNADDRNDYHELEVDDFGNLSHVIWNNNNLKEDGATPKDFRTKEKKRTHYKLVSKPDRETGKKYWIGYSPVQWSYEYHKTVLNSSDEEKSQKQMILVECKGIKKGEEELTEHIRPYNKVEIAYFKDEGKQHKIKSTLKQIHQTEIREERRGGNDTYEDMFVSLHDPIGCATDICSVLSEKVLEFHALTEAIQTGESEEDALSRLQDETIPKPKVDVAYQDMYSLALTTYHMVYSSKKNIKKFDGGSIGNKSYGDTHFPYQEKPVAYDTKRGKRYKYPPGYEFHEFRIGRGTDRIKVESILGVRLRKKRREEIIEFRSEYGNFIKSDFYKNALKNYTDNSPEYCLFGMAEFHEQVLILFNNPYDVDRHMLVNSDVSNTEKYKKSDVWIDWLVDILLKDSPTPDDDFEKLLLSQISLKQDALSEIPGLMSMFDRVVVAKLQMHSNIVFKAKADGKTLENIKSTNKDQQTELVKNEASATDVLKDNKLCLLVKTAGTLEENLKSHSNLGFKTKYVTKAGANVDYQKILIARQTRVLKSINKIKVTQKVSGKVAEVFKCGNTHNIMVDASKLGVEFNPNVEVLIESSGKSPETIVANSFSHKRLYGQKATAAGGNHQIDIGEKVESISKAEYDKANTNAKRFNAKAAKILKSRGFTGALTALQLLNFSNAVLGLSTTLKNQDAEVRDYIKSGVNLFGVSAELSEAFLNLKSAHLSATGRVATEAMKNTIKRAGAVGGAITSVICFWDGCEAFGRDDGDAGLAYIGAGVAYGVATIIGILGISGPVGWIALGIGFGLVALANVLTDSDMEFYFKHFVLCDQTAFELNPDETPMDYNRRLFIAKRTLVDYDEKEIREELMHPTNAIASLHDLTVCKTIEYFIPKEGCGDLINSGHYKYCLGYEVTVSLNFSKFLVNKNQLEPKGIILNVNGESIGSFLLKVRQAEVIDLSDGQKQLIATLALPNEYKYKVNRYTKLVVAIRICIDKEVNHYFPFSYTNSAERYMGACISLFHSSIFKGDAKEQEIKFGSIEKLKNRGTW